MNDHQKCGYNDTVYGLNNWTSHEQWANAMQWAKHMEEVAIATRGDYAEGVVACVRKYRQDGIVARLKRD